MKIAVIGPVGFPAGAGGVTRHSEELYARMVSKGVDVTVFTRRPATEMGDDQYRGMTVVGVWAPKGRGVETLVYGAIASLRALLGRYDVVHYQGVASATFCWLQRLRVGRRLVVTHHSQDWQDEKWSGFARRLLRWTAAISLRRADEIIAVSEDLGRQLRAIHDRPVEVIPSGVTLPPDGGAEPLGRLGLRPKRYVLSVGRIVPEKRLEVVIDAFEEMAEPELDMAIVGAPRYSEDYANALKRNASPRVKFLGLQTGPALGSLYAHASAFVTASLREGLPLSLLEAMGSSIPVVASDIPAHRDALDGSGVLFRVDDAGALAEALRLALDDPSLGRKAKEVIDRHGYDWDDVVARTLELLVAPVTNA